LRWEAIQALQSMCRMGEEQGHRLGDVKIIESISNAVTILANRLTGAENDIHGNFGAIRALRADLSRTDEHILALEAGRV
jgi:hypothetical protein